jgi:uncharacterized protein
MADDNLTLAKNAYAAFGRGDIPAVLEGIDDNVEWTLPNTPGAPIGGTQRGKAAVGAWFQKLGENLEFHKFEPVDWIASGDKVVIIIKAESTIRSTGKPLSQELAHVHTYLDGKLVRFREYSDSREFLEAFRK